MCWHQSRNSGNVRSGVCVCHSSFDQRESIREGPTMSKRTHFLINMLVITFVVAHAAVGLGRRSQAGFMRGKRARSRHLWAMPKPYKA